MIKEEFASRKSDSVFIAAWDGRRGHLSVTGYASTNPKVVKELLRIRREGADYETVKWIARQFAATY